MLFIKRVKNTIRFPTSGILLVLLILVSGCSSIEQVRQPGSAATPYTAIVVAYAPEMQGILGRIDADPDAQISDVRTIKGIEYRIGTYHDDPILVFATGISVVNAAMSMQMAIDYFPIKQVVFMGIAGAVNPKWHPGDVVIPERWYYHDESIYVNPTPENRAMPPLPSFYQAFLREQQERRKSDPYIPDYRPFGFIHPNDVSIIKDGLNAPVDMAYFSVSNSLLDVARRAVLNLPQKEAVPGQPVRLHVGGNGVTGSVFLDNREYRQWVREVYQAEVTEMESAAIGQVCTVNEIDWIIIRAVSDLAGGQEGINSEHQYQADVSRIGAEVLFALLGELAR